ncbi:MAG: ATP-binding protein [Desulfovibrionaceae bacterium]|nr:ATP-binding protein [Desulfovibrionaceae bacterium]
MPEIILPAKIDCINEAMDFLRRQIGEDNAHISSYVELAVEELLINVVNYAFPDASESPKEHKNILLGCRYVNMDGVKQFCVWVKDRGVPFDPFELTRTPDTSLNVEEREIGGLGVHIVKNVSNHYVYSEADGTNTVELYFKLVDPTCEN